MVKVLFVCMGNICRSPLAEGAFCHLLAQAEAAGEDLPAIEVDSAGTISFHAGEPPDARAQDAARQRSIDLGGQVARRIRKSDFYAFDYILAMDRANLADLQALRPADATADLRLFLDFAPDLGIDEVPDPYYGGRDGFDYVLDLVEAGAQGLLNDIRRRFGARTSAP